MLTFCYRKGRQFVYLKTPPEKLVRKHIRAKNVQSLFSMLSQLYYKKLRPQIQIRKYWNPQGKPLTDFNLFLKYNLPYIYSSIQQKRRKCSTENWINMAELKLTCSGKLHEPCRIKKLSYEKQKITLEWETNIWNGNGKPDDTAHIVIIYCKPTNTKKKFILKTYYGTTTRQQGKITIEIKEKLIQKYITALLFFTNNDSYSDTIGASL